MAFSLPNRPMALDSCVSVSNKIYFVVRSLPSPRIPRHAPIREERIEISRLQSGRVGKCITRRLSGVWATYPVVVGKPVCKPGGGFAEAVPRLVHRLIHQRKGELSMLRWRVMHCPTPGVWGAAPRSSYLAVARDPERSQYLAVANAAEGSAGEAPRNITACSVSHNYKNKFMEEIIWKPKLSCCMQHSMK